MSGSIERARPGIALLPVTQAMRATFVDFQLDRTLLDFIRPGSKRVECPIIGERVGQAGDVRTLPPRSVVTMENRPPSTTATAPTR